MKDENISRHIQELRNQANLNPELNPSQPDSGKVSKQSDTRAQRGGENLHRFGIRRSQKDPTQWMLEKEIAGDHLSIILSPEFLENPPEQVQDVLAFFRLLVRSFSQPSTKPPRDQDQ